MAITGKSISERITTWDVLVTNLKPNLTDMPYLSDDHKALEESLTSARVMQSKLENLRSQNREITQDLKVLLRSGDKLRSRLHANLKGKLGFTAQTLVQYGAKPLTVRRRKKDKPQEEPVPVPAPHAATAPASPAKP